MSALHAAIIVVDGQSTGSAEKNQTVLECRVQQQFEQTAQFVSDVAWFTIVCQQIQRRGDELDEMSVLDRSEVDVVVRSAAAVVEQRNDKHSVNILHEVACKKLITVADIDFRQW